MASQAPNDNNSNTKSEQETMAFHKKRARRVSFAENTSVHIFNRDEDSGTPVNPKPPNSPSNELIASGELSNESNQLLWSNVDDDDDNDNDNNDDDDEDEPGSRSPFLRFVGSPSSGGSTIGSANSNDEYNFFGPVSANFIRRDLLDSVPSDDNHDQTMDSTAFSMHFRSLAGSESDVELKTSTAVHLSYDEKTPTQDSIPTNTGTLMQMTQVNNPDFQPSVSISKLSNCSDSNDMSIVGEYRSKYDYAELSPTLDAILASDGSILKSPRMVETANENDANIMDFSFGEDNNLKGIITRETVNEGVSHKHNGLVVANDGSKVSPSKNIELGVPSDASDAEISKHMPANSSIMVTPNAKTTELVKDMSQIKSSLGFSGTIQHNLNPNNTIFLDDIVAKEHKSPFKTPSAVTRSHNHSSVFARTIPSIQKSISKLRMLEASPFSAVLNAKLEDSISKSVFLPSKMTPLNTLLERNHKSPLRSCMKDIGKSSSASQKKRERLSSTNVNDITFETPINKIGITDNVGYSLQKKLKTVNTSGTGENVSNESLSTTAVDKMDSLYIEMIEQSGPLISTDEEMMDCFLQDEEHENRGDAKIVSPVLHERTDNQSCQKDLHDQFCQSPLNKQTSNVLDDENTDSLLEENVPSPSPHLLSNEDLISSDNVISTIEHNFKTPTEINEIISEETKELLSQSVDKLNLHAIDRLTSIVDHLRRSKTYQLLSDEIKSQKSLDADTYSTHKRVAEVKQLLCNFVHEKAKLRLLNLKRERLLKRAKSLASGLLESEVLRLDFSSRQQSLNVHCESSSVNMKNLQENQIDSDKVTSMGQTLNQIDRKIENLTKTFHKSCKMKGEPNSDDTLAFVNNFIMKRARCQIIRKDLQLWSVDKLENINGCHSFVLNYLDLMTQRFTVNAGIIPTISISLELNNENIIKFFKDMNACTAFKFVFNAGMKQKEVDSSSLAKETQVTGSRFGNLLNVAREIQQARLELNNVISTRFQKPSAEQLDLELCFFDSKRLRKITLTLDISCLGRGIYPSEIVPYQINDPINDPQSSSSSGSIEIASSFQDLNVGYFRIQRLCRLISELISPPPIR